jgi:hypothetical protein
MIIILIRLDIVSLLYKLIVNRNVRRIMEQFERIKPKKYKAVIKPYICPFDGKETGEYRGECSGLPNGGVVTAYAKTVREVQDSIAFNVKWALFEYPDIDYYIEFIIEYD